MSGYDPSAGNAKLREIIDRYWSTPENAEWTQKREVIPLDDLREWMKSEDIEIAGFAAEMIHDRRFRIEPELSVAEYIDFIKKYSERCIRENREEGEWADSRFSAAMELVNTFGSLWWDSNVERSVLVELKSWLAQLYKGSDEDMRVCLVHATLEHLVEQQPIRDFFPTGRWTQFSRRHTKRLACGRTAAGEPHWEGPKRTMGNTESQLPKGSQGPAPRARKGFLWRYGFCLQQLSMASGEPCVCFEHRAGFRQGTASAVPYAAAREDGFSR